MKLLLSVLIFATVIQMAFCFFCMRLVVEYGVRAAEADATVFAYEKMHNEKRWSAK